jgi:hypothetical protein
LHDRKVEDGTFLCNAGTVIQQAAERKTTPPSGIELKTEYSYITAPPVCLHCVHDYCCFASTSPVSSANEK